MPSGSFDVGAMEDFPDTPVMRIGSQISRLGRQASLRSSAKADGSSSSSESPMVDTKGIEEIVETWAATAQEVMADAMEMSTNIDDAAQFAEASLSYLRTRLLRMELAAMIVSLALTFGAMVGGIFGMNLKSGLEK